MMLVKCRHCGARVIPTDDGVCPDCQKSITANVTGKGGGKWILCGLLLIAGSATCAIVAGTLKPKSVRTWGGGHEGIGTLPADEARELVASLVEGGYSGMRPLLEMIDKEIERTERQRRWLFALSCALGIVGILLMGAALKERAAPVRSFVRPPTKRYR